jgi:hypothetical protein
MEIYLGRRAVRQIRDAAREAVEDGDSETLREEITDAFHEDDVQAIERTLDGEDLYDFINTMLEDWSGDDVDELFELLESQFAEIGIDLTTEYSGDIEDTEVMEDEDEFPPSDDDDDDDDDGDNGFDDDL